MPFPILGSNSAVAGYEIDNSVRFNDDDSAYLSRANSSGGSNTTGTLSFWTKRSEINTSYLFYARSDDNNVFNVYFSNTATSRLEIRSTQGGLVDFQYKTNMKFRDVSAWYHIVIAIDTTDGTAADRCKLFVNGSRITSFETQTNFGSSDTIEWFQSDATVYVSGEHEGGTIGNPYDGYIAEMYLIDGQQLAPTEFGETNENGVWIPKRFSGSYGTNGFKLEFKNSGSLGTDTSGNGNNFTATNLTATDQTTDTPTNNFCTLNPLDPVQGAVYSEGNCKTVTNSSNRNYVTGTFGLTSGKWYWEAKLTAVTSNATDQAFFGIADLDDRGVNSTGQSLGDRANEVGWHQEEGKYQRNNIFSSAHTASWGIGDICAIALDADNNRVTIAKNGQWADGSGNADESSPTAFVTYTASTMTPAMGEGGGGTEATWECNFGNSAFSISSGNSDANGYGNFEYAVPSGYYALCTKNLAEYG